jgi:hypothetical protein
VKPGPPARNPAKAISHGPISQTPIRPKRADEGATWVRSCLFLYQVAIPYTTSKARGHAKVISAKELSIDSIRGNKITFGVQNEIPPTITLTKASQKFFIELSLDLTIKNTLPKPVVRAFHNSTKQG